MSNIGEPSSIGDLLLVSENPIQSIHELARELLNDPESPCAEDVRSELHRVVESLQFNASERNRRFLEYVVEETLAGRADRIKAYNIATTVFGRDVSFDPQLDPVVRMEARRLRNALERFYLADRNDGNIKIELPKGAYIPIFRNALTVKSPLKRVGEGMASRDFALDEHGSSILVTVFESEGEPPISEDFNIGLARHLMVGLSRFPEFFVFGTEGILARVPTRDHKLSPTPPDTEFILTGSTSVFGNVLQVEAMLVQPQTGRVLWGRGFHRDFRIGGILSARDEIANCIVRALAEPFGVIFNNKARPANGTKLKALSQYEHVIQYYQYRRRYSRDLFPMVREDLKRSVMANPDCAETVSCLSLLYSDAHRLGFPSGESAVRLRRQAVALAYKAIELAPNSSRGYHALGLAHWFMQDVDASLKALQTALSLNPNATETMADLGLHWTLLGDWGRGVPLLEEAFAGDPGLPSINRIGLSLYHFVNGCFSRALAEAVQIRPPDCTSGFVAQAISLVRLGRKDEAAAAVGRILDIVPRYTSNGVLSDVAGGNVNRDLAKKVWAALQDAGLPERLPRA